MRLLAWGSRASGCRLCSRPSKASGKRRSATVSSTTTTSVGRTRSTVHTRYGDREQLTRCAATLRANGLEIYLDLQLNHRKGGSGADGMTFQYLDAFGHPGGGRFAKNTQCFHSRYPAGHVPTDFHPEIPQDPNVPDGIGECSGIQSLLRSRSGADKRQAARLCSEWAHRQRELAEPCARRAGVPARPCAGYFYEFLPRPAQSGTAGG